MTSPIYLDYNATTPIAREVAEVMAPYLYEHFGNPSSSHPYGAAAKRAVEAARVEIADFIGSGTSEVILTSGGTESNNYAIQGIAYAHRQRGKHIITSAVEHPAVIEVCRWLEVNGFHITVLPVDEFGMVDPHDLERAMTPETILVTVMHANNEVGTIQPVERLAKIAHQHGALMHTDAAQSVGKIVVDVNSLGVDLLSIAGHKVYAPKGIGALYIKRGTQIINLMFGAGHENGHRPGTENVLEIVGLGAACRVAGRDLEGNMAHFQSIRTRLMRGLLNQLGQGVIKINGHPEECLPNTLSVSFRGVEANTLLQAIEKEIAASAGAACHADEVNVSSVLQAMKLPLEWAMGTVRFSVGRDTTPEEIDHTVKIVAQAVKRLGSRGSLTDPILNTKD